MLLELSPTNLAHARRAKEPLESLTDYKSNSHTVWVFACIITHSALTVLRVSARRTQPTQGNFLLFFWLASNKQITDDCTPPIIGSACIFIDRNCLSNTKQSWLC